MRDNVFFERLDKTGKKYYKVHVNNYKLKYLNPIVNMVETFKLFRKHKFDLIHTHGYRADVLGIFLSRLMDMPVISTCHGYISNDLYLALYNTLDRFMLRFAQKIIAVSNDIKNDLIRNGVKEARIRVVQNAVNGSYVNDSFARNRQAMRLKFRVGEKEFVIGYVGRLSEEKGVRYLIEAVSLLNNSDTPVKLIILGAGPQRKELEDLVKKVNIENDVIFAGFQGEVEKWLPAMDLFVLPSLTEGTPMSLLEAMASGLPVVASAVGGVPQVIDSGKNGILVSPGNPDEIRDAVLLLYNDKDLRDRLSKEAQKTIKMRYDVKDWISKIETEYLNTIN
jgi:glycosyltransferase involved in cell wall biosynthesis